MEREQTRRGDKKRVCESGEGEIVSVWLKVKIKRNIFIWRKLYHTTLNYALDYTLHHKLLNCTLCTINYHTYHTLHSSAIFAIIFNRVLLYVTSTCFFLKWNKVKRLKHLSSKLILKKPKIFHISLCPKLLSQDLL